MSERVDAPHGFHSIFVINRLDARLFPLQFASKRPIQTYSSVVTITSWLPSPSREPFSPSLVFSQWITNRNAFGGIRPPCHTPFFQHGLPASLYLLRVTTVRLLNVPSLQLYFPLFWHSFYCAFHSGAFLPRSPIPTLTLHSTLYNPTSSVLSDSTNTASSMPAHLVALWFTYWSLNSPTVTIPVAPASSPHNEYRIRTWWISNYSVPSSSSPPKSDVPIIAGYYSKRIQSRMWRPIWAWP